MVFAAVTRRSVVRWEGEARVMVKDHGASPVKRSKSARYLDVLKMMESLKAEDVRGRGRRGSVSRVDHRKNSIACFGTEAL